MLSFIMYYLLKNPDTMQKLRDEIDTMIGDRPMVPDDINKLPYLIGMFNTNEFSLFSMFMICF